MMVALFALFFLAICLAWFGLQTAAVIVSLFNLALSLAMLFYHATSTLHIRL